ncbi:MAG: bifunctional phosphopantothenoylcysteine decarboxylase/phosphopantothenate--cysteine ligase CoaBC [SAR202 cluster bacterium]|nr:bifunctional phosphopantothenoylcysteine decarboxylase/phosphopantothenate--cysteine ligase CoaBC [SAR202 cluster bacterium]
MPNILADKKIVLGVTGSIACYKAVDLASKLKQAGALVEVILTESAQQFLSPLSFNSITHQPVVTSLFDTNSEAGINHVALARRADIVVVAPATANTIAKIANGQADDALGTTVLATEAPIMVCPAMDGNMYESPATQANIATLKERGIHLAGPEVGHLASGQTGIGRLIEPQQIASHIRLILGRNGDLAGKKIVVSAGGTRESLDPVREITNRSSGKMGYAIAEAALDRGASVVLVSTPTNLSSPVGATVVLVKDAADMYQAIITESKDADGLVMAAAVADWQPVASSGQKAKKSNKKTWAIELTQTPDIIASVSTKGLIKVGFAAETESVLQNAEAKIKSKNLDIVVANDVSSEQIGFGSDNNEVTIIDRLGRVEETGLLSKYDIAWQILDRTLEFMKAT